MLGPRTCLLCWSVFLGAWGTVSSAWGQTSAVWAFPAGSPRADTELPKAEFSLRAAAAGQVPLEALPPGVRERVQAVVEQPTLSACGPIEEFMGQLALYQWFLEHPDRAAQAWRRRGAPCLEIVDRGSGRFGWTDAHGSDVVWETAYRGPGLHVWYAEGCARPILLLPPLPGRAVVVLHYRERPDLFGETHIQHHADVFVQTDSKTAALVLKVLGPSLPRMTEQALAQFCFFFSNLTQYLCCHPEKAAQLLK